MTRGKAFVVGALGAIALGIALGHGGRAHAEDAPVWTGVVYQNYKGSVLVTFVLHGSPADLACVNTGDAIEAIDGHEVPDAEGLHAYLRTAKDGQNLVLSLRDQTGAKRQVTVVAGKRDLAELVKTALRDGAKALASRRAPGGAGWARHLGPTSPDDVGSGLTALVCRVLAELPPDIRKPHEEAIDAGLATLLQRSKGMGWVQDENALAGQSYETYATAETILALVARRGANDPDVAALASGLAARQLRPRTKLRGYPDFQFTDLDWQRGGFPFESLPIVRRNDMRVTVGGCAIAVEALHAAGYKADSPEMVLARGYFERTQNVNRDNDPLLKDLKDGGFPESPRTTKAGIKEVAGDPYYRSYGSASCDGLAALIYTGAEKERIGLATDWVRNHFELSYTPGFPPSPDNPRIRNPFEQGIRFYYVAALARALSLVNETPFQTSQGTRQWPTDLLNTLLADQRRDGFWKNRVPVMDEDNEVVATSFALFALEKVYPHLVAQEK